jgi:uracil-DNA glycosylase
VTDVLDIAQESTRPPIGDLWYGTSGPIDARIVVVGEAWGASEAAAQKPFIGASGQELTKILAEGGIDRKNVLITNVVAAQPPRNELFTWLGNKASGYPSIRGIYPNDFVVSEVQRLHRQLVHSPRTLIIATGNYALWALSSCTSVANAPRLPGVEPGTKIPTGIGNWRGSMIYADQVGDGKTKLLPIFHPAAIMRTWGDRAPTVHDIKARVPMALADNWEPSIKPIVWAPPTYEQCISRLDQWLRRMDGGEKLRLAEDIETYRKVLITCIGFAESTSFAMSIPFVRKTNATTGPALESYWTPRQEAEITHRIGRINSHPNSRIEGQNFIYDTQYIGHYSGVYPRCDLDTMLAFHLCFPGIEKGLDYLSSLFCRYHRYWKEDGKDWDGTSGTLEQHLGYNAEDCLRTFEIATTLRSLIVQFGLAEQWEWTLKKRDLALRMMERAILIDGKRRDQMAFELMNTYGNLARDLIRIIPQEWIGPPGKRVGSKEPVYWYESNTQLKYVFQDFLGIKIPNNRKTGNASLGKEALNELAPKHPQWAKLFALLGDLRSVGVFISHFIRAPLEPNGRMRCSFNPAGTETLRWSSSKNAFGRGANLQNLSKGTED